MNKQYSQKTLETLLDTMPDYIFYRDLEGKITYCNKSYADNFINKPKNDIYGKRYEELNILQPYFNIGRVGDREVVENATPLKYEQTITKENDKYTIEVSKYPTFDEDKNMNGILGVIKVISYKDELSKLR